RREHPAHIQEKIGGDLVDITANEEHITALIEPEVLTAVLPSIKVFTTRPDTLYGATYMVVAPEHQVISNIKDQIENVEEVTAYLEATKKKTELERLAEGKEKTGIELKGVMAINPATEKEISIYVADYVLAHYGTGAIMAVPAHDERDYEFAKKYDI